MPDDRQEATVSVAKAARRLDRTPDAIRAALRRGTLGGYRDNHGEWRIPLSCLPTEVAAPVDMNILSATELRHDIDRLLASLDTTEAWRRQAEEAKVSAAELRAEVRLLREALDRERERADRLDAEMRAVLAEARKNWWRRLIGS